MFLLIGIGYGLVVFVLVREALRAVVDPAALVPQLWVMRIVVNLLGPLVVPLLIGGTNRLLIERLGIHGMGERSPIGPLSLSVVASRSQRESPSSRVRLGRSFGLPSVALEGMCLERVGDRQNSPAGHSFMG
ncbi:hypothetical protein [Natronococcus sp. A-GB7]|uniref:hypothetical protein n=1 Tax=Natronococcus sp. A-GB7 TaxID=3037649 RepID=UPI0024204A06|nr:hypothetical protein [Natronococcus sp. A-GB7]MDG5818656.1 hypothetical protein [Natronococcus sp. A-GB7]